MTYYICPKCQRTTSKMTLLEEKKYEATEIEKRKRSGMEHIAHETLECPCGLINTWYTVIEMNKT